MSRANNWCHSYKEKENIRVNSRKDKWQQQQQQQQNETYFSHKLWIAPQYASGTPNHSQSPGPILMLMEQKLLFSWWPGVRLPGTFMYNWTVFMPRMIWPTCDNMLLAEITRAKAGNFINSCSWGRHFLSSDKSTLVPNLMVFRPSFPLHFFRPKLRITVPTESLESESESNRCPPTMPLLVLTFSCSSYQQLIHQHLDIILSSDTSYSLSNATHLETLLETGSLVLGVFSDRCNGSVRHTRPRLATHSRIPVLIRRLL